MQKTESVPEIRILKGLDGAAQALGDVVVIDVMRAFTTAAYGFAAGLESIELVSTVDEAMSRNAFRMGEVGGKLIPGFDHSNSPSKLIGRKLSGPAVQRTGAGTQCVVAARQAETIWLGSLLVARATADCLADSPLVSLVASGYPHEGVEDLAAALLIQDYLLRKEPDLEEIRRMIWTSLAAERHRQGDPDMPEADIDAALAIDRFDFAMKVDLKNDRRIARVHRQSLT